MALWRGHLAWEVARQRGPSAFLAQERVLRIESLDFLYDDFLAGAIHLAHIIVTGFCGHRYGIQVTDLSANVLAGSIGCLYGDIEDGLDHGSGK